MNFQKYIHSTLSRKYTCELLAKKFITIIVCMYETLSHHTNQFRKSAQQIVCVRTMMNTTDVMNVPIEYVWHGSLSDLAV